MYQQIYKSKNFISVLFLISILYSPQIFSQINPAVDYFPINVGDVRIYEVRYNDNVASDSIYYETVSVVGTEIKDGKKYFVVESNVEETQYIRVDSSDATVWRFIDGRECMTDSLSLVTEEIIFNECNPTKYLGSEIDTVLGLETDVRTYGSAYVISQGISYNYSYAKGIGLVFFSKGVSDVWVTYTNKKLCYAKINGVEYGVNPHVNFFPMHVGDTWQYLLTFIYRSDSTRIDSTYDIFRIYKAEVFNNKKYFLMENPKSKDSVYFRIDSSTADLWVYKGNEECMIDSFSTNRGEVAQLANCGIGSKCISDSMEVLFGELRHTKSFVPMAILLKSFMQTIETTYAEGIGIVRSISTDIGLEADRIISTLTYANIDGKTYGEFVPQMNYTNYYPLQVGNKWVYVNDGVYYDTTPHPFTDTLSVEVLSDTITNEGIHYFKVRDRNYNKWMRIDSLSSSFYAKNHLEDESECLFVSFPNFFQKEYDICYGKVYAMENSDTLLWNEKRDKKIFSQYSIDTIERTFVDGIGLVEKKNEFDFGHSTTTLMGCLINGVLYGDTTTVDVNETPLENITFSLSQNYPNPFNPTTIISYSIPTSVGAEFPSSVNVKLVVYDILGRGVTTLVNKEQKPGNYKFVFDASSFSSGIYFYSLIYGNERAVKKMILLQ